MRDLASTLETGASLVARGRASFDADPALPLACEALCTRAGEIVTRLVAAYPERFDDPIWSLVARNRDFLAHHYDRIDAELLWRTVQRDFPDLLVRLRAIRDVG